MAMIAALCPKNIYYVVTTVINRLAVCTIEKQGKYWHSILKTQNEVQGSLHPALFFFTPCLLIVVFVMHHAPTIFLTILLVINTILTCGLLQQIWLVSTHA